MIVLGYDKRKEPGESMIVSTLSDTSWPMRLQRLTPARSGIANVSVALPRKFAPPEKRSGPMGAPDEDIAGKEGEV